MGIDQNHLIRLRSGCVGIVGSMKIAYALIISVALFGCGSDIDSVSVATDSSAPISQITIIDMQFSLPENAMSTDRFELKNSDSVEHNLMLLDDTLSVDIAAGETVALPQFEPGNSHFTAIFTPA